MEVPLTESRNAGRRTGSGCFIVNCLEQAEFEQSRFIHLEKASKQQVLGSGGKEFRSTGVDPTDTPHESDLFTYF